LKDPHLTVGVFRISTLTRLAHTVVEGLVTTLDWPGRWRSRGLSIASPEISALHGYLRDFL